MYLIWCLNKRFIYKEDLPISIKSAVKPWREVFLGTEIVTPRSENGNSDKKDSSSQFRLKLATGTELD